VLFSKKKLFGLDIGSSAIKLAEIDVSRKGASLVSFGVTQTPPNATQSGDILDPQAISEAIISLVQEVKTRRKLVATGLWGNSVIVKRISIPRMDEKLVSEQIRWEAEQYIPYDIKEVNLEFKILSNQDPSSETMDILLVAAIQESIYKTAEIVQLAGLQCAVLDVEGFALANCYEKNYESMPGEAVALMNIGASVTNFSVIEGGEVIFCRDIPVGGNTYTQEIHKALGISMEEAEAIKLSLSQGQPAPEQAQTVISSTHEVICDEINGSVDFFLNTSGETTIAQSYLTGGGAKTPGLLEQVGQTFPCKMLDPFRNIKINHKKFSSGYIEEVRDFASIAVGLGLRTIGDV
jgi:type IV pilus assembly protein PilM